MSRKKNDKKKLNKSKAKNQTTEDEMPKSVEKSNPVRTAETTQTLENFENKTLNSTPTNLSSNLSSELCKAENKCTDIVPYSSNFKSKDNSEEQNLQFPKKEDECSICLRKINERAYCNQCLHFFCLICIQEWSNRSSQCPVCRTEFNSIIHNVKSNSEYDTIPVERRVRNTENNFTIPNFLLTRNTPIVNEHQNSSFIHITTRNLNDMDEIRRFFSIQHPTNFQLSLPSNFQTNIPNNPFFNLHNLLNSFREDNDILRSHWESLEMDDIVQNFDRENSPKDINGINFNFRRHRRRRH